MDEGEHLLSRFESSPGKFRYFCSRCGSQVTSERVGAATVMLRLGCLDTPAVGEPKAHIWRSEGAAWYDPKTELRELPEGFA